MFYSSVRLMNVISHAIEERVVSLSLPCEVYAGFQRFSLIKPQLPRYRALAECAKFVYLYGIDDTSAGSSVDVFRHAHLIRFPIDERLRTGLERFWFVVVDDPHLHTALVAQHTSGDFWSPTQRARTYSGFWTFDPDLVGEIVLVLRRASRDLYYPPR